MIEVKYLGTLGNNMFQYALGRILAEEMGYELSAEPIYGENFLLREGEGFKNTIEKVEGKSYDSSIQVFTQHNLQDLSRILDDENERRIFLNGWFQRYEFIKPYKDRIKHWYEITDEPPMKLNSNDLVLTIRRTWKNYPIENCLPFSFFENLLEKIEYDRVIICTDVFDDPFFNQFEKYSPIFAKFPIFEQFNLIKSANKIVMTESTYCWWAGFLSEAKEIYFPLVNDWKNDSNVSLEIDDEDRFIYVDKNGDIV